MVTIFFRISLGSYEPYPPVTLEYRDGSPCMIKP